jgi:hypothetical protein
MDKGTPNLMILINKKFNLNKQIVRNDSQGRWILLNMKVDEKEIWLIKEISNIMDTLQIVDIWRLKNPDLVKYTWRRLNQASHLDYILVSFSLASKIKKVLLGDRI